MELDWQPIRSEVGRAFGAGAESAWERFLVHVGMCEGFALHILLVPDAFGGRLCRAELEGILASRGQSLRLIAGGG